jgi:hypothetical protein
VQQILEKGELQETDVRFPHSCSPFLCEEEDCEGQSANR